MRDHLRIFTPILLAFLGLTLGVACTPKPVGSFTSNKTVPDGWVLTTNGDFVSHLEAKEVTSGYRIELQRKGKNSRDSYYIRLAESLYPDPKVVSAYQKNREKSWYFEKRWWVNEFDGYRIPYSITGDAVNYYIDRYRKFKEQLRKQQMLEPRKREFKDRVSFSYQAKVIRPENSSEAEDSRQVIVKLSLKWYVFCGQPCGWGFEKTKEVTFAGEDQILEVKGDGITPLWESSVETPYAPHQWITY